MLAVWKEADDIEIFESGWTFDHFYPIFSDPAGPCLEGWMTLAALAQATRRLRLGPFEADDHHAFDVEWRSPTGAETTLERGTFNLKYERGTQNC